MSDPIQFPHSPGGGIERLRPLEIQPPGQASPRAPDVKGKDFKSIVLESLDEVNRLQAEADQGIQDLITGKTENVAEVLATANKAGIAFDLLMEVRNKLTEAYQEIKQMQI